MFSGNRSPIISKNTASFAILLVMLMVLCSLVPFIGNFAGETEQYLEDLGEPMASPTSPGHTVFAQFITSDNGGYDYAYASPAHIQAQEALPDEYVYIAYHSESYGNTADAESGNIAPIYGVQHLGESGGSPKTSFGDATPNNGCGSNTCWDQYISSGGNMHSTASDYDMIASHSDNGDGTSEVSVSVQYTGTGTPPSAFKLYAAVTELICDSHVYSDGSKGKNCWEAWLLDSGGYVSNDGTVGQGQGFETISLNANNWNTVEWTVSNDLVSGGSSNMNIVAALYSDWSTTSYGEDVYVAADSWSPSSTVEFWSTESAAVSDSNGSTIYGDSPAIAIRSLNSTTIAGTCYYDDANHDLQHSMLWANNSWSEWWTDLAGNTGPDGAREGVVGEFCSIAYDDTSNRHPHISFYDATNMKLKYTTIDNNLEWQVWTVDSGNVGMHSSIALDSNNEAHFAYYDAQNASLKYAWPAIGGWQKLHFNTSSDEGKFASLALDSDDNAHISYYDATNKDMKYIFIEHTSSGGVSPSYDTVYGSGNQGDVGEYSSIAIDSEGTPHISYMSSDSNNLYHAFKPPNGSWLSTTVDSSNLGNPGSGYGRGTSLAIDSNDHLHIAYFDDTNSKMKYAKLEGPPGPGSNATWTTSVIDSASGSGAIAIDENDDLHIVYPKFDSSTQHPEITYAKLVDYFGAITQNISWDNVDSKLQAHASLSNLNPGEKYTIHWQITNDDTGALLANFANSTLTAPTSGGWTTSSHSWDLSSGPGGVKYCMETWLYAGDSSSEGPLVANKDGDCITTPTSQSDEEVESVISWDEDDDQIQGLVKASNLDSGPDYQITWRLVYDSNYSGLSVFPNSTISGDANGDYSSSANTWSLQMPLVTRGLTYCVDSFLYTDPTDGTDGILLDNDYTCLTIPDDPSGGGDNSGNNSGGNNSGNNSGGNTASWETYTLPSARDEGYGSSMAIDGEGNIHVSYYDYEDGMADISLKYSFYDGNQWSKITVDSGLGYSSMASTSLALDENDCPVILYFDQAEENLLIRYSDPVSSESYPCSFDATGDPALLVAEVPTQGREGFVISLHSLAMFGEDTHIVYTFYCAGCEETWAGGGVYYISEPEISPPQTIANSPLSGFMAIDASDGVPTVAHYDADTKDLHYSTLQSDNSWSTETINTEVNLLGTGSILSHKKYQDTPSVVYVEQTTGMLKMASNPGGAGWAIYNITDDTDGGTDTSLALHNGSFGIAFTSGNSSDISNGALTSLKYANISGIDPITFEITWSVITVDDTLDNVGINPSIVFDEDGKPIISYLDYTSKRLKVACDGCSIFSGDSGSSGADLDADGVLDDDDDCEDGETGWTSSPTNDYDGDGCKDATEDWDDDNDGIDDGDDSCYNGQSGWDSWQSDPVIDYDHDGCLDSNEDLDDDQDGISDTSDSCSSTRLGAEVDASGCETGFEDEDGDGVSDEYDGCPNTPSGTEVDDWNGCPFDTGVVNLIALLSQDEGSDVTGARLLASYIVSNTEPDHDYELNWYIDQVNGECAVVESRLDDGTKLVVGGAAIAENPIEVYTETEWTPGEEYCLNLELFDEGEEQVAQTIVYLNSVIGDNETEDSGDDSSEDETTTDVSDEWWAEIPVAGEIIAKIQSKYGKIISASIFALGVIGYGYRIVTMRSEMVMNKRVKKFKKRIDAAKSASVLRRIQSDVEQAEEKRLLPVGAFGDLLSMIEVRAEDLGLTDFVPKETLAAAGISQEEFQEGMSALNEARDELFFAANELRRQDRRAQRVPVNKPQQKKELVSLKSQAKSSISRPSYHPKDINRDGSVDEEDERVWAAMSDEERAARTSGPFGGDTNLTAQILAFSKLPSSSKSPCHCGSRKQYRKCHMKKDKCPCGSNKKFLSCCARKRGFK